MKMFSKIKQGGFTLIEIILTLVIAAVVGTGLVQYLGSSLTKSSIPIQRLKQAYKLHEVMENITADYRKNFEENLAGLKSNIGEEGEDMENDYGEYTVTENTFILFDTNTAVGTDTQTLLKVTIKYGSGNIITTLFSSQ